MVWGIITYGSRSSLMLVRDNITTHRYDSEILEPYILPYLKTNFLQYNARPHVARLPMIYFEVDID